MLNIEFAFISIGILGYKKQYGYGVTNNL